MYFHLQQSHQPHRAQDEPDPAAANALQEGLGGQFGEMRTMMQYLFQSINFRGPRGKPYKDLIQGIGTEEISHVELIGTTIARLLDGSPRATGQADRSGGQPGAGGATPLSIALSTRQHPPLPRRRAGCAAGGRGGQPVERQLRLQLRQPRARPALQPHARVDRAPAEVPHLRDDRQQDGAQSTISYLIVRDQAHENAYAKALETLGVNWRTALPIPKTNAEQFPEVKRLLDLGLQSKQYSFDLGDQSEAGRIFQGAVAVERRDQLDATRAGARGRADRRSRPSASRSSRRGPTPSCGS